MNKISLSNNNAKAFCILGDVVLLAIGGLLIYLSLNSVTALIITTLLILVVGALLVAYTIVNFTANIVIDNDKHLLTVNILKSQTFDTSEVKFIYTHASQIGQKVTRILVFADQNKREIFSVATFSTGYDGAINEVLAENIATVMNVTFIPTVDKVVYDKQAQREAKEKALLEEKRKKAEKKARRNAKRKGIEYVAPIVEEPKKIEDDVNYDELDENKLK